jgi:hypothetical protein
MINVVPIITSILFILCLFESSKGNILTKNNVPMLKNSLHCTKHAIHRQAHDGQRVRKILSKSNTANLYIYIYNRKVLDLADLRQRIIEAVELITRHMLINTWKKLENRLDICQATTGAHIEVY